MPLFLRAVVLLLLAICIARPQAAIGQATSARLDSLTALLSAVRVDSAEADFLHELSAAYARVVPDSAIKYAEMQRAVAERVGDSVRLGQAYNDLGVGHLFTGAFDEAIVEFALSSGMLSRAGENMRAAKALNNTGAIHEHRGDLQLAMEAFIGALREFDAAGEEDFALQAKNNVATIYNRLRNFDKALELFRELESVQRARGDARELAYVRGNQGVAFNGLGLRDSARTAYEEAIAVLEATGQDNVRLAGMYVNLGQVYREGRSFNNALEKYAKGLAAAEATNNAQVYGRAKLGQGIALQELGKSRPAVLALQESLPYLEAYQLYEELHGAHFALIKAFAQNGQADSAVHYADLYQAKADSTQSAVAAAAISELETKYQTEQQERALAETRAARLEDQLAARKQLLWLLGALALAILLGGLGYVLYSQQRLRNRQQAQEAELELALARIEAQNKLQEQRLRISRDLHDNIGAQLSFIISTVDNVRFGFAEESPKLDAKLNRLSDFAGGTVRELRDTVWAMNKDAVGVDDLRERIANFLERAAAAGYQTMFSFEVDEALGEQLELSSLVGMNVYRIIQEAVHNALKYAEAERVQVRLAADGAGLQVMVEDNGKGMSDRAEEEAQSKGGGNGLHSMRKRAAELGGTLVIDSQVGVGTTVNLALPSVHTALPAEVG